VVSEWVRNRSSALPADADGVADAGRFWEAMLTSLPDML